MGQDNPKREAHHAACELVTRRRMRIVTGWRIQFCDTALAKVVLLVPIATCADVDYSAVTPQLGDTEWADG